MFQEQRLSQEETNALIASANKSASRHIAADFARSLDFQTKETVFTSADTKPAKRVNPYQRGDIIANRYRIEKLIGRGGAGYVHYAQEQLTGRAVSLKSFEPTVTHSRPEAEKCFRNGSLLSRFLTGDCFPEFIEFGMHKNRMFVASAFVEGTNLSRAIRSSGVGLPPLLATNIAIQAGHGLHRIHRQGMLHRDVKPSNLLLNTKGRVVIIDFDAMIDILQPESPSAAKKTSGSPHYMSPEQIANYNVDERSDVYSLACSIYEFLTTCTPFAFYDKKSELFLAHNTRMPAPPSVLNPGIPQDLDRIVLKGLAKDPGNRYQSAAEMCADLEKFQNSRPK